MGALRRFAALAIGCALPACGREKKEPPRVDPVIAIASSSVVGAHPVEPPAPFSAVLVVTKEEGFDLETPRFQGEPAAVVGALNAALGDLIGERVDVMKQLDALPSEKGANNAMNLRCRKPFVRVDVVSVECVEDDIVDGHPLETADTATFAIDGSHVRAMKFDDLFAHDDATWKAVMARCEARLPAGLSRTDAQLGDRFAFADDGLAFHFRDDPDLGPARYGDFRVVVPYAELAPYARSGTPLARFAGK